MAEFNYTHFLRTFYGDIVERGQCEKLGDFIDKNCMVHFPGKDLNFEGYKEWLSSLSENLRNISVEISNDKLVEDCLYHDIFFQGNRKSDMGSVEWRTSTKWKMDNNKVAESWPQTSMDYKEIQTALLGKQSDKPQGKIADSAIPLPAK